MRPDCVAVALWLAFNGPEQLTIIVRIDPSEQVKLSARIRDDLETTEVTVDRQQGVVFRFRSASR